MLTLTLRTLFNAIPGVIYCNTTTAQQEVPYTFLPCGH